eukprot:CAMPEP_0172529078 /NCGR_PEP_ID=MMETSP1067-20121228/3244_1 /TAXON_ID=265564 ORGANISM="Thalassiosira punctigera, Strain Tpunct2005C2" /NCGR_SAMPLE_ID=MMETSP1067 /ASSEMBLY_ACC=CAM_ASM_000444 /LENGTH=857 /DNA_ID=CAMNT_0013313067 /DNA_START=97 /DNA_END=2670 /DNA_ORIENTATION=-
MTNESSPLLPSSPVGGDNGNSTINTKTVGINIEDQSSSDFDYRLDGGPGDEGVVKVTESLTSWVRLLLFFVVASASGGVVPGQNVYNRLFCEAGVFAYACGDDDGVGNTTTDGKYHEDEEDNDSCCPAQWLLLANVMNALSCLMAFSFFAAGLLFDMLGGRLAGAAGCLVNALGFVVLALLTGMLGTDAELSPAAETASFVVGVLLVDVGSMVTNISFYGFLWHLPRQQALILSLSNCVMNVAAFVPLALRAFLDGSGRILLRSLPAVLSLYAVVIILVATPMCWFAVPSMEEYRGRAMEVLSLPIPARKVRGMRGAVDMVKKAWQILEHHARLHLFTIVVGTLTWMAPFVYMTMTDPMAREVFGTVESGERLATMYNVCNGYLGLVLGPLLGVVVDRFRRPQNGVELMGYIIVVTLALIATLCAVPSWTLQMVAVSSSTVCQICMMLFMVRYAIIFAPPDRVGSVTGLFVAGLGALSFVPIIAMSVDIALNGSYVQPQRWICIVGLVAWIAYIVYVKRTSPWPGSPVLLPEDERKLAKVYGVGTIEDAAYVSGKSIPAFRRLSSSSNVLDQRALLDAAFTGGAAERIMEVARRRSSIGSTGSTPSTTEIITALRHRSSIGPEHEGDGEVPFPQYPIVEDGNSSNTNSGTIRRGTAATSLDCIVVAFNGHGGFGGRGEPSLQWVMETVGEPDDPKRIAIIRSVLSPMVFCAELVGTILEMRIVDEDGREVTAAACTAFHPGSLENGTIMETGSDRYYCSLTASKEVPIFMDRNVCGEKMIQRFVGVLQDSVWDDKRREYAAKKPMWYIGSLGTHPKFQGRGLARRLLSVAANWARRDGADCYLECSEENVPFYERVS